MAKVKYIDLKSKKLEFIRNDIIYKIQCLKILNMSIDVKCFKDGKFLKNDNLPFAQLPKELKKIVNPK